MSCELWNQLGLDGFWRLRLPASREGTPWLKVLQTLVTYRLIDPGSEWRLHRHWFDQSAMADLLDADFGLAEKNALYRCLDKLVAHKDDLFKFLVNRWGELFGAKFLLAGNTADSTTLSGFLERIEMRYGKADRIWVMDRGVPTEESLAKMRAMGASYLVGTPKGRLSKLEQGFLAQPWQRVRDGVDVKRLGNDEDTYVLAQSGARIDKERAMRRKRLRRYVSRLQALQGQLLTRDQLLMKVGAAKHEAGRTANLVKLTVPGAHSHTTVSSALEFRLDRDKLRQTRRREGRDPLRTNLCDHDPDRLWTFYIQLTEVEQAFKELKHDLAVRPIYHRTQARIEAHIFVAFLAYCLQTTLKAKLRHLAHGLTPAQVILKVKSIQMVDVHLPTTDGRELIPSRYTQPELDLRMLLDQLRLKLPKKPPPKVASRQVSTPPRQPTVVETFR